jgi:hypothetical protein
VPLTIKMWQACKPLADLRYAALKRIGESFAFHVRVSLEHRIRWTDDCSNLFHTLK